MVSNDFYGSQIAGGRIMRNKEQNQVSLLVIIAQRDPITPDIWKLKCGGGCLLVGFFKQDRENDLLPGDESADEGD